VSACTPVDTDKVLLGLIELAAVVVVADDTNDGALLDFPISTWGFLVLSTFVVCSGLLLAPELLLRRLETSTFSFEEDFDLTELDGDVFLSLDDFVYFFVVTRIDDGVEETSFSLMSCDLGGEDPTPVDVTDFEGRRLISRIQREGYLL